MVVDRAAAALERAARRAAIAVEEDVASAAAADGPPAKVSKTDQALINAKEKSRQRRAIAVSSHYEGTFRIFALICAQVRMIWITHTLT